MATLKNRLELEDGMSPVLNRVKNTLSQVASGASGAAVVANRAFEQIGQSVDNVKNKLESISNATKNMRPAISGIGSALSSTIGKFTIAGLATNAITALVAKTSELAGSLRRTAEEYAGVQARLKLVTGSQEKAVALNEAIYQSALRTHGAYDAMADSVAKIAMTAKEAFPDPKEVVPFMEGIQKLFSIGGTGKQQQGDALLQLTQALGSGKLQGDEFRSIAEAAPLIEQMVSKYLGISQGALKDLSSKGEITAEVLKNAIIQNMDEINRQFDQMPITWSDNLQDMKNEAYHAFGGVYDAFNDLATIKVPQPFSDATKVILESIAGILKVIIQHIKWFAESDYGQSIMNTIAGIIGAFILLGVMVGGAIDAVSQIIANLQPVIDGIINNIMFLAGLASESMGFLAPVIMGVGLALAGLAIYYGIAAAGALSHAVASAIETAQIIGLILAQEGLNAALAACPLTWIVMGVIAVIVAFYLAIGAINRFVGTSISATGIIFGVFMWLFTGIANLVKFVINRFIDFANFLMSVFQDPTSAIYNLFADIWNGIVELVAGAVNEIVDIIGHVPGLADKVSHVDASGFSVTRKAIQGYSPISHVEYASPSYNAGLGYEKGVAVEESGLGGISDILKAITNWQKTDEETQYDNPDTTNNNNGDGDAPDSKAGRETANNTGRMANALDMLEDEVKELREFANQEMINYYTRSEYNISVGDINNSINRPADIDGVIDQVTMYIMEGMNSGAEAVHA